MVPKVFEPLKFYCTCLFKYFTDWLTFLLKVVEAGGGWGKLLEDRPPNPMILEAQKYVQERLEKKWLPLFLTTPDFAIRQKPRTSMDEVVDDVLVQKRKKSQAVWKVRTVFAKFLVLFMKLFAHLSQKFRGSLYDRRLCHLLSVSSFKGRLL